MADRTLPKYIAYRHELFLSSLKFQRGLSYMQRHMYRALCLEAPFCNTRPYLPTDDAALMLLADVPEEVWKVNKDAVLGMFTLTDNGYEHHRITEEYEKTVAAYEAKSRAGRASAAAKQMSTHVEHMLNESEQNGTDIDIEQELEREREGEDTVSVPQEDQPTQTPHREPCMRCNGPCYLDGERKIHCSKCHALQTDCKCKAKTTAVSSKAGVSRRKVGFDPWSVAPFDGWTADQIKLVVDWHWGSNPNAFWRNRVTDEAFFKKHFESMSSKVPVEAKKTALHTTPKFKQEEI